MPRATKQPAAETDVFPRSIIGLPAARDFETVQLLVGPTQRFDL
jgi:hypothetical protein